jgi:lipoprotein-anchoring transpeptidase ErfK/SrfK
VFCAARRRRDIVAKHFLRPAKQFPGGGANVLKRRSDITCRNDAPNGVHHRRQTKDKPMFNLDIFRTSARRAVIGFGTLTAGMVVLIGSAAAAPLPLFPFIMTPPVQSAPQAQPAPQIGEEDRSAAETPVRFKRQIVNYPTHEAPGTIVIDTPNTYLYLVLGNGQAMRYGIGVGRDGFTWSGVQTITRKAEWPDWTPPPEMIARQPYLPRHMAGGPGNPLGARAMYLGNTVYRIHGTNAPETIGTHVSSGCIRLTNENVADLYSRVGVGTKVVVLPMTDRRADNASGKRG